MTNITVGLMYALMVGPLGTLAFGLAASLTAGPSAGFSAGLVAGLMFGLVAGLRLAAGYVSFTHEAGGTYRLRTRFGNLAFGLVLGLAGGIVFGSVAGLVGGPSIGPAVGIMTGLLVGPALGLVGQFELIDGVTRFSRETTVSDVLCARPGNLMLGLVYGLVGGLSAGLVAGPVAGITAGLLRPRAWLRVLEHRWSLFRSWLVLRS
ncbi:hypothetical protein [Salinispora arenicola]|uniref:hypothetical protein n=1 Tax=Salinispora arenicola TaxID=168697 RepID=UPI00037BBAB0|nr:hypothetical protein [Salinispora arenicola]